MLGSLDRNSVKFNRYQPYYKRLPVLDKELSNSIHPSTFFTNDGNLHYGRKKRRTAEN